MFTLAQILPGIGPGEMMLVGMIALLLFGKKLPDVARSLGKGVTEFKKGLSGIQDEIREATSMEATESPSSRGSHGELPHATEPQAPEVPKFEPPTSPPVVASNVSESAGSDAAKPVESAQTVSVA